MSAATQIAAQEKQGNPRKDGKMEEEMTASRYLVQGLGNQDKESWRATRWVA
jgi:hypothetical protein